MSKHYVDIFTIRRWRDGWTMEARISRPANAPSWKQTQADRDRTKQSANLNLDLCTQVFPTLDDVLLKIREIQEDDAA